MDNVQPFSIHGIELITFSILPLPGAENINDAFEFNIQQEQKTNAEKHLVIIFTHVIIKEPGADSFLATIQVACGFEISSFETIIKKDRENNFLIPHELNVSLNRIAVATTRGILYVQLRGSYLQNTTLPIVPFE